MPRKSERQQLVDSVKRMIYLSALFDDGPEMDELIDLSAFIQSQRFITSKTRIPKGIEIRNMLWDLPDHSFKQIVRLSRDTFCYVLTLISEHELFTNNSLNEQRPVWIQLMVTLERMGCDGNGASVGRLARVAGIGNGTVTLYCKRVVQAVLSLKNRFIKWPNGNKRKLIAQNFFDSFGIPNVVGVVDGTHIHFSQKPAIDGEVYWTRKCRYHYITQLFFKRPSCVRL